MSLLARLRPKSDLNKIFQKYFGENQLWLERKDSPSILAQVVNSFRPRIWKRSKNVDISPLLYLLQQNENYAEHFRDYLKVLFENKRFDQLLTDADIINDVSFLYEFKRRIIAQLIPNQPDSDSVEYVLTQVFYVKHDIEWLNTIPEEQFNALYQLLSAANEKTLIKRNKQLTYAAQLLTSRIAGAAVESEVIKMVPEYENFDNPFLSLQRELQDFLEKIETTNQAIVTLEDVDYKHIMVLHSQCLEYIDNAYKNTKRFGISLRVNQYLLRIRQQLHRLYKILTILLSTPGEQSNANQIGLIRFLISINYQRNNVLELLNLSTKRVAFEITQHKAKSGEHYITKDKSEYRKMLNASLGGGAIVGLMCIAKLLLSKLDVSPFGYAFLYSMNYALGFIIIYLLGYTLATKQPAMTASSFIKSLEEGRSSGKKRMKYESFAILFSQLWRSQFIAFVGNVFMAFPVALMGIWIIDLLGDINIAETKSEKILKDIHPFQSLAIFHAAIAGVYLFLSGIIAGSVSNSIKHNRIPFRIKEHPLLKVVLGKQKSTKIANFIESKYAGISSNFWFGVFLGSTGMVGYFLGINIDIRHITFASGNLALGIYGADWHIAINTLIMLIIGVGLIGLFNFIVSFTLSVIVAMRSCDLPLYQLRFLFSSVFQYFIRKPLHFFLPLPEKSSTQEKEG
jgi:site-specific recombinase